MTDIADLSHPQAVASEVLAAYTAHKSLTPFSSRPGGLTMEQSTRVLPMLRAAFEARGEKILGAKNAFPQKNFSRANASKSKADRESGTQELRKRKKIPCS